MAGLLAWAVRRGGKPPPHTAWWVLGGGLAFPVLTLSALLAYTALRTAELQQPGTQAPLVVSVTGRMWWWEVRYRTDDGQEVRLANELRLPLGRPAQIALQADEVIHSLWVPALGGKVDLIPGRVNHLRITPTQPGLHRGQCAEFCGLQHAKMALHVQAMPAGDFKSWLRQQAQPAASRAASAELLARGRQAFLRQGCASCHSVRGVADGARLGPDLTHVASRHALGAGVLPNGPGALRRWLVEVQALKPGARMPGYAHLDATTLDALGAWLEQLR
ncbi:c-type cytochrome [Azohydromonas sp. G-1-1-14]|uniref:C-type cytochrome n=2 Tax=Azohydromonas caseinilytica TaxID=2728836 RepID=A0A848FBA3_9BURK|nr:c-type cytochrome [Azohydromonas caseinilytica]